MVEKLDLRKRFRDLYSPSAKQVSVVDVPRLLFTMIDGEITPGESPETSLGFQQAIGALYGVGYTLKFMSKLHDTDPLDYTVMALEGLWSVEGAAFDLQGDEVWQYTLMMLQPEHITDQMFQEAVGRVEEKGANPALRELRMEHFTEGLCMQIMHIGPYADEPGTIERMHAFARDNGYRLHGRHHEIYLGDPRRAKPENLKTVLRHPIAAEA